MVTRNWEIQINFKQKTKNKINSDHPQGLGLSMNRQIYSIVMYETLICGAFTFIYIITETVEQKVAVMGILLCSIFASLFIVLTHDTPDTQYQKEKKTTNI